MKWFRDIVLVPVTIAFLFVLYGAWYTGVKLHAPFGTVWLRTIFTAPVPLWGFLLLLAVCCMLGAIYRRTRLELETERTSTGEIRTESEAALEAQRQKSLEQINSYQRELMATPLLQPPQPTVQAVWEDAFWGEDIVEGRRGVYLMGWATFSMRDSYVWPVLIQASVNGGASFPMQPIHLERRQPVRMQFFVNTVPRIGTPGQPLTANIVLTDTRNRQYAMPEKTFEWSVRQSEDD